MSSLPSERDQNFRIVTGQDKEFVLKLSQLNEAPALLDCQHRILKRLAGAVSAYRFRAW